MANAFYYSNAAQATTLSGSISAGAASVTVGATTGFPGSFPYVLALDFGAATEELVTVTAAAGTTLTVTRGYGGTSAQTHSLGAVVRHVYNAQDATDFRTHEAATAAVHGVSGTLVGTNDTQTLVNKTLTSPTINGAALSGTVTGTPTFTGGPSFTTLSALFERAATTDPAIRTRLTGDTNSRLIVNADGKLTWGTGMAAGDTTLYRSAADTLTTDDAFTAGGAVTAAGSVTSQPAGTSTDGLVANLPASTTADLASLKVNASVKAAIGADGAYRIYQGNSPTTFTPNVAGVGTATWTTRTGWSYKVGKMTFVAMHFVVNAAGSGASNVTVDAPITMDGTTDQILLAHFQSGSTRTGYAVKFAGSSSATFDRIRVQDAGSADTVSNLVGSQLTTSAVLVIQGWIREA